jgi:large subunit ribosomal protein L43
MATRFSLRYCLHSGSSRGVRSFIEGSLKEFARRDEQLLIELALQPGRHPTLRAEYGMRGALFLSPSLCMRVYDREGKRPVLRSSCRPHC